MSRRPVRIGNASGFYGDRLTAMRDLVAGTDIDVITGDYLAELTMLILWKAKQKNPDTGYARTFLTQFEQVVTDCGERGIKIVVNAGGLNPAGMAAEVRRVAAEAGVRLTVAHVEGDDLIPQLDELRAQDIPFNHLDTGSALADAGVHPVSANAYLGGWGIAAALRGGADVVITGRVTDAALVVGVGAWWHDWARTDYDALAGAVAAGHIIECGPQATGGNYSQLQEITDRYGDERRTVIQHNQEDLKNEDLIDKQDLVVTLSHAGYAKAQPVTDYRAQRRGGKGRSATAIKASSRSPTATCAANRRRRRPTAGISRKTFLRWSCGRSAAIRSCARRRNSCGTSSWKWPSTRRSMARSRRSRMTPKRRRAAIRRLPMAHPPS